jgi:hypothetical protein
MSRAPDKSAREGAWLVRRVAALAAAALLGGCLFAPSPTPSPSARPSPSASPSPAPSIPSPSGSQASAVATATPEPPLSLPFPPRRDQRQVRVDVQPQVGGDQGEIVVRVSNVSGRLIRDLVLRWPSELDQTLYLAPFRPSEQRIAEFGPPLIQEWTKWVLGPGEQGEPAGTTSLGWGPLLSNGTLTIPIQVTRTAPGEVAFDLQVLAGESILSLQDGTQAELRVTVP